MLSKAQLVFDNNVNYHYEKFPPDSLDYSKLLIHLGNAAAAIARFDQALKTIPNSGFLIAPLIRQEAVLSSKIEGTISTMDEIFEYEAEYGDHVAENFEKKDVLETVLYKIAMGFAQQALQDKYKISDWLIRGLHQKLLIAGRGADKSPGQYKTEQNYIIEKPSYNVLFTPISPENLSSGMNALFSFIEHSEEHPLIKIAIAHVEFEALHPFRDGNGRIGRMLIPLMLYDKQIISKPHFYISGFFEKNKHEYIETMRNVSKNNDWTSWCLFFLKGLEKQASVNLESVENVINLYESMKNVFRDVLKTKYHDKALDFVFKNPVFRNSKFIEESDIPVSTAYTIINSLLEHSLIKKLQDASGSRSARYMFEPLVKIVRV